MRIALITIYIGLALLLVPWLPIAIWSMVFLSDPIITFNALTFIAGKVIPFLIVVYPAFLLHGFISSWRAMRQDRCAAIVLIKALYPLLFIIPVLLITVIFLLQ